MYVLGGGGVWFWQQLLWLAHIWIKHSSKTLRAIDGGFVFQLLPMQSWTTAILEGKQYSFQLQKWQAPWLFMLCSVCFVFISVLFLERPLETACPGASRSRCPRRGALCRPSALRDPQSAGSARSPHRPHSHEKFATSRSSDGSAARAEPKIQLPGSSPKDFFVFLFMSFPEFSFRLTTTRADTAPPRSLGLNPQRINFKLLP